MLFCCCCSQKGLALALSTRVRFYGIVKYLHKPIIKWAVNRLETTNQLIQPSNARWLFNRHVVAYRLVVEKRGPGIFSSSFGWTFTFLCGLCGYYGNLTPTGVVAVRERFFVGSISMVTFGCWNCVDSTKLEDILQLSLLRAFNFYH